MAALLVSIVIGRASPVAGKFLFGGLVLFWLTGLVGVLLRDFRSKTAKVFEDRCHWDPKKLPREFQFIRHRTTRSEFVSVLGEYCDVADTGVARYDLPSGGAVFIFMQKPVTEDSMVDGVQYYPSQEAVPVFPS